MSEFCESMMRKEELDGQFFDDDDDDAGVCSELLEHLDA